MKDSTRQTLIALQARLGDSMDREGFEGLLDDAEKAKASDDLRVQRDFKTFMESSKKLSVSYAKVIEVFGYTKEQMEALSTYVIDQGMFSAMMASGGITEGKLLGIAHIVEGAEKPDEDIGKKANEDVPKE